tara:strand:- start:261 stop:617 length:357 start_codon:yes stop_codon:yes gene_type:complete
MLSRAITNAALAALAGTIVSLTLITISIDKEYYKMPATLNEWPSSARGSKYKWYELFDGKIYKLVKGEDFDCDLESFRVQAYGAARNRGLFFRSSKISDTELAIQATAEKPVKNGEDD